MISRIHILGASGSGTTTLAHEISQRLQYRHFDTDNYYWIKTDPPFTQVRERQERIELLSKDLQANDKWVLSGSLCGWGDELIPFFDLVVFLWIPNDIRMQRLEAREYQRYGDKIKEGGSLHSSYLAFMEWASKYDTGDMDIRSRMLHDSWLEHIPCRVLRIEGDLTLDEKYRIVEQALSDSK